jgi:hypothetical protein
MSSPTLSDLRSQVRQRANMENSTFVTDSEFNRYINLSIAELYDMLSEKDADYNISSSTFSLIPGNDAYNLPVDFYRLRGVDLNIDSNNVVTLKKFEFEDRNRFNSYPSLAENFDIRYRLRGNQIVFSPGENISAQSITLWYIPLPVTLSSDSSTLNGYNGWEEIVIVKSAIKALVKEEQETSQLQLEYEQLKQRLEAAMDQRDSGQPSKIYDNQSSAGFYRLV